MRRRLLAIAGLVLALAACADDRQDVFTPEGGQADKINRLQVPVFIVAGVVGLFVAGAMIFIFAKYRSRRDDDDTGDPVQVHGNFKLEIGWTIAPAVVLAFVAVGTVATLFDISDNPSDAMRVRVFGQQWWWSYEYELDGNEDNGPEIVTANDLVIPAGQPVVLEISARDVIHSFWIPSLGGTRDAVPGRVHRMTIEADQTGIYDGQCKEFCGLSHANMRARVVALSDSEFNTWLDQQQQDAESPSDPVARAGEQQFATLLCSQCHMVRGLNDDEFADRNFEVDRDLLVAGHAPDLTHFMSRGVFASGMRPLYTPDGDVNRIDLEEWLRNPHQILPMAATDQPYRGMPDLNLTEDQIDELVAYLETLGPQPPLMADEG